MGSYLSYKAHVGSSADGFITAAHVTPSSIHDTGGVPNLIESHENIFGTPLWIAADTKYGSEECLAYLQDKGIKTSIKPEEKNSRPDYFSKDKFSYDKENDCYICPNGKVLKRKTKSYTQNRVFYKANRKDCIVCPQRDSCISGKAEARLVTRYDSLHYEKAKGWYYSSFGKTMQKLRSTILEGIMGQAKSLHGMNRAKFRGLKKVEIQLLLTATAINLKKMVKVMNFKETKSGISNIISGCKRFFQNISSTLSKRIVLQVS